MHTDNEDKRSYHERVHELDRLKQPNIAMTADFIPYGRHTLDEEDLNAVKMY